MPLRRRIVGAFGTALAAFALVSVQPWFCLPEKVQDPTTQSVIYKCPEGTHEVVVFGIVIGCWFD